MSIALPQYEVDRDPDGPPLDEVLLGVARDAERLGLDGVWLSDHPFAVAPDGTVSGALEPLVVVGAVARATGRSRIGTLVLAASMRSPALVAHTARALPSDRVTIGVGAGWYEPEHRAFGVPLGTYEERAARVASALASLRELGPPRPQILAGGSGKRILDAAALHADEWTVSWDVSPTVFTELTANLDAACERAGRDPASIGRSVGLTVLVGRDERAIDSAVERLRRRALFLADIDRASLEDRIVSGSPARCAERIASYDADEVIVAPLLRDDHEMLELFAKEVAPALRR